LFYIVTVLNKNSHHFTIKPYSLKETYSNISILFVLFILVFSASSNAQLEYNRYGSNNIWDHWYGQVSIGANAFYGDISSYDSDPIKKIKYETSYGYSASFGKWINRWGAAQFTFSGGELIGTKNHYVSHASFYQYAIEGMLNVTELIHKHQLQSRFYGYIKAGYGFIEINAFLTDTNTGKTVSEVGKNSSYGKRVTEWVIPFGGGGFYNIDKNYSLFIDVLYQYVDSDKLDARYDTETLDNYVNASFGLRYTFDVKNKRHKYRGNSARKRIHWVK